MMRKAFLADIASAASSAHAGISDLARGEEDGEVTFLYTKSGEDAVMMKFMATDVSGYPSDNIFFVCTISDNASAEINDAVEDVQQFSAGSTVDQLLSQLVVRLSKFGTYESPAIFDASSEGASDFGNSDAEFWPEADMALAPSQLTQKYNLSKEATDELVARISKDLGRTRTAGYKIGVLTGMRAVTVFNILSISMRISQLGLPLDVLDAWNMDQSHYVVLLIRFSNGYKTLEKIIEQATLHSHVDFRIGSYRCRKQYPYKPSLQEALCAFSSSNDEQKGQPSDPLIDPVQAGSQGFKALFISASLDEFLNGHFIALLKIRCKLQCGWDAALNHLNSHFFQCEEPTGRSKEDNHHEEGLRACHLKKGALPLLDSDHVTEVDNGEISFPLVAMQFAMHYLLRCTEYCLVCHGLMEDQLQAIKPYVCSKPLCLFQYMSLGFGPSIEHEILTQPSVVDLLVSFCYVSAHNIRFREYPTGMNLKVIGMKKPDLDAGLGVYETSSPAPLFAHPDGPHVDTGREVCFDSARRTVVLPSDDMVSLGAGDWIMLVVHVPDSEAGVVHSRKLHFRVRGYTHPVILLASSGAFSAVQNQVVHEKSMVYNPEYSDCQGSLSVIATPPDLPAQMFIYSWNIDDFPAHDKCQSLVEILDMMPSVKEMRTYLLSNPHATLHGWVDRMPPAALGVLRWIISSNRSSIVQVGPCPGQDQLGVNHLKVHECVGNMPGMVQFRFAQGTPEMELRFREALAHSSTKKHRTILGFHGSPLMNWHSIIRQGLDFKEIAVGRTYGDGVYHAKDVQTSLGYSGNRLGIKQTYWPGSELQVISAVCLNEIVNAPEQFTSVDIPPPPLPTEQMKYQDRPMSLYRPPILQDPAYFARGTNTYVIVVPGRDSSDSYKKFKPYININVDDTDPDDLGFMIGHETSSALFDKGKGKGIDQNMDGDTDVIMKGVLPPSSHNSSMSTATMTPFTAGSLDQASLPLTLEPTYATSSASKTLNRALKDILKIQASTPLSELGWYIDGELISNIYQWIIELHSFDLDLLLAKDMKKAKVDSIVCEIRFPADFPLSPPWIRVIRPRFLPFMNGGGGNVTIGGAMCMEFLTNTGWSPANTLDGVLLQVRMAISAPQPAARLSPGKLADYGMSEAMEAYLRACRTHGWAIPPGFSDFGKAVLAAGSSSSGR